VALSAFDDPAGPPAPAELAATLGEAARHWAGLIADVRLHAGDVTERWVFGGPKYGWSMRLMRGERVLVHMTPQAGHLLVGVVLGEKAIAAGVAAGLASERTIAVVEAAPRYAEGRGVRFSVETDDDLGVARELARLKLAR
jgi:hypothetical protein